MRRGVLFAVWGLAGLCSMTSCSFLFVHGPPPDHERLAFFDCSSSNVLPVLDAVYAGAAAADAVVAGFGSRALSTTSSARTDAFLLAGEAAIVGASAVYGFRKTSDCRKAQAAMLKRAATQPVGGPTFGAPAAPAFAPPGAPPVDPWTGRPVGTPAPTPAPEPAPAP
ncbi:MAG TPA: hypothetical protein VHM31_25385 [Polyangia bacterium]|nr:hypothetical protein [Polyangia bacterium]